MNTELQNNALPSNSKNKFGTAIKIALLYIPLLILFIYCSFIISKNANIIYYSSGIFDADVGRITSNWTSYEPIATRTTIHPFYKIIITPFGSTLNKVLFNDANPLATSRIFAILFVSIYTILVGFLTYQLSGKKINAGILAGFISAMSFSTMFYLSVPEMGSIAGSTTLIPLIFLNYRIGKDVTLKEIILWGIVGTLTVSFTITQVVHFGIAIFIRIIDILRINRNAMNKDKVFSIIKLVVISAFISIILIVCIANLQKKLIPTTAIFYKSTFVGAEKKFMRTDVLKATPFYQIARVAKHFILYDFVAPYPELSDYLIKDLKLDYYTISIENRGIKDWTIPQFALFISFLAFIYIPIIRFGRWNCRYIAPLLSVAAMFSLHLIYGREYVLYSYNWHGVVVALIISALWTVFEGKHKLFTGCIIILGIFMLLNNISVMKQVYLYFNKGLKAPNSAIENSRRTKTTKYNRLIKSYNIEVTEFVYPVGNKLESITDNNIATLSTTFNNTLQQEAWFEVDYNKPVVINKIIYAHGYNFRNGGWFNTSKGKPTIWALEKGKESPVKIGELSNYPNTNAESPGILNNGQMFEFKLNKQIEIVGIRIEGIPTSGNNPRQSFASCAELRFE